jgi:acyl-CoA synthetase (AMP-forming)/AMP-acid ligase II
VAEVLYRHGVGTDAFVAVFMTNSPEMVFVMLALAKLGAVPAMINNALRSKYMDSDKDISRLCFYRYHR